MHVPFKSAPDAVTAVVRGDAQMYFAPVNLSKEMAEAGKVRRDRGRDGSARFPEMPDVPTFREAGLDYVYDSWFGLMTQAGVPRDIVHKINRDVVAILRLRRSRPSCAAIRHARADTPEEFDRIIGRDGAAHRGVQGRLPIARAARRPQDARLGAHGGGQRAPASFCRPLLMREMAAQLLV